MLTNMTRDWFYLIKNLTSFIIRKRLDGQIGSYYDDIALYNEWVHESGAEITDPDIEYTGQKDSEPITLMVYAGADTQFTLYNDEGTNYNYEKGEFAKIRLTYDDNSRTLTIGERQGSYSGIPAEQQFNIVLVSNNKPVAFGYKAEGKKVNYKGEKIVISL